MTVKAQSPGLIQSLSVGNVVNVGLQLYRLHWKTYLRVAAIATAWVFLPILVGAVVLVFYAVVQDYYSWLGLLVPAWLVLLVFCIARWMADTAAINRLAFTELMQQPESVPVARRFTQSRQWSFVAAMLLVSLLWGAVFMVGYIVLAIVLTLTFLIFGGLISFSPTADIFNPAPIIAMAIVFVVLLVLFILGVSWFGVRFALVDVPLAIESETTAGDAIGRSWSLTQKQFWRLFLVFLVVVLLTLPVNALVQVLSFVVPAGIQGLFPENPVASSLGFLVVWAISLLVGVALVPLWQTVRTVLYFDLRSRREGLGLVIPERSQPQDGVAPSTPLSLAAPLFHRITLSTPESVDLEFTLAGIGNRALALVIDYHILFLSLVVFWIVGLLVGTQLLDYLSRLDVDSSQVPLWLLAIALLISFAIYSGYFVYFEGTRQGQTPGKRFVHIRVIRDDGRPIGLAQSLLRALLRPLDDFLFIGSLLVWLGKQEKRIGDLAAGTLVVQEEQPQPQGVFSLSEEAKALAQELPTTTRLSFLLPDDFAVIRAYLQRRSNFSLKPRSDLSLNLARQVRTIIQLETVPPDLTSDHFLEAVYLAYQKQSER